MAGPQISEDSSHNSQTPDDLKALGEELPAFAAHTKKEKK